MDLDTLEREIVRRAESVLQRINSLTLRHNAEHLARFQAALSYPTLTPIPLQDLKILHRQTPSPAAWEVPAEGMATKLPSIRSLTLANIEVYWESFPIRSLTKLSLEGPDVLSLDNPCWAKLGPAMSKMDSLTHLNINLHSLWEWVPLAGEVGFKLSLPRLTSLVLYKAPHLEIGHFLDHTDFPRLQSIYVQFSQTDDIDFASFRSIWTLLERGNFGRLDQLVWDRYGISLCGGPLFKFGFKANLARTAENMTGFVTYLPSILARDIVYLRLDLNGYSNPFDNNWAFNNRGLDDGEILGMWFFQ